MAAKRKAAAATPAAPRKPRGKPFTKKGGANPAPSPAAPAATPAPASAPSRSSGDELTVIEWGYRQPTGSRV